MSGIQESQMSEFAQNAIAPTGTEEHLKSCRICGGMKKADPCRSCTNRRRTGTYHWNPESRKKRQSEGNPLWKGDNVGIEAVHDWVRRRKDKPLFCERCGTGNPIDMANISGEYKRDINDYEWLCRRCHMVSDGRLANFKTMKRGGY